MQKRYYLFILCLSQMQNFLFFQIQAQEKTMLVDQISARVGHHIILESDIKREYAEIQAAGMLVDECDVFRSLFSNYLLLAKASLDSVTVSEEEVETDLNRRMEFVIHQVGSKKKIEEIYGKPLHLFKEEIREEVRDQLIMKTMSQKVAEGIKVTPREVKDFFEEMSESERPYYSTEVSVAQIVRFPQPSKRQKEKVVRRLLDFRSQILSGEDFGKIAQAHSMDPSAIHNQGILGFVQRGQTAPEYESAALRLKVGEISLPTQTAFGYHIIRLIEQRGNQFNTQHILLIPEPEEKDIQDAEVFLEKLRRDILAEKISFQEAAQTHSEDERTAYNGGFFRDNKEGREYVSVEEIPPLLFFTLDTLEVGTITPPLGYTRGDGRQALRILYYKDKIPAHAASLSLDYNRFHNIVLKNKRKKFLEEWLQQVREEVYVYISTDYDSCPLDSGEDKN
ncbi:MAG: peptidylprolyl isomerase [Cytophagales bacterium]|nr:peptidylprolyl isomerase [Cytophagales bacterium]